jgi:hypothetical protein
MSLFDTLSKWLSNLANNSEEAARHLRAIL